VTETIAAPLRQTPLHDRHVASGARMVGFGGWSMPVQYTSIIAEHQAVRSAWGIFDVSHMGEFKVSGPEAREWLGCLVPANLEALSVGHAVYTMFTRPTGGVVDDLIVYRFADHLLLVVNAANRDKDWAWLQRHLPEAHGQVTLEDVSEDWALIAVQGPSAAASLERLSGGDVSATGSFGITTFRLAGIDCPAGRTGYTGEDGFEVLVPADQAARVWDLLVAEGASPCGLGARDTLRLEAGLPLYGHEWDDDTTPIEAGFGWAVRNPGPYLGRDVHVRQKAEGPARRLRGLVLEDRAPAREGYEVVSPDGEVVGKVASGTFSPTLGHPVATAYLPAGFVPEQTVSIRVRERLVPARVVALPFYRRPAIQPTRRTP